jgi:trk system potassium uptake protein TrkH
MRGLSGSGILKIMELDKNLAPVSYAVRPAVVARYFGSLCLLLALSGSVPVLFALIVGDYPHAVLQALACTGLALPGWWLARKRPEVELQHNEALVVVVLAFITAAVAFALPMAGRGLPFASALFESISGITTTGLTTIANIEAQTPSVLFTAAWLQWVGGLGIMVLAYALLFGQGVNAMHLAGVLGEQSSVVGGTRAYGRIVLAVYLVMTLLGILLLRLTGLDWFGCVTLALAAVSTGGYSPYQASIAGLGTTTQAMAIGLGMAGALSMLLYHRLWRGQWRTVLGDAELRALCLFALLAAAGVTLSLWQSGRADIGSALQSGVVTALSAQSTTGFETLPISSFDSTSRLLLIFSMLAGGGVGSTAGGIKLLRILILLGLIHRLVMRSRLPAHAVAPTTFLGRNWTHDALQGALLVVILHLLVVGLSWLTFLPYDYDPLDALFEVVSATGTVGLSTGITSASLPGPLQAVLMVDMLLGRLEILAVLVFLSPRTWLGQQHSTVSPRAGA